MVSIIVPIFNADKYLNECIDSILAQSYKDFEVLLVDDGSTDHSREICEEYVTADGRVRFFHQKNAGVSAARNLALDNARGVYVCFVDSDDVVDRDYLSHLSEMAERQSLVLCQYTSEKSLLGKAKGRNTTYEAATFIVDTMMETVAHPNIWLMLFSADIIEAHGLRFTVGCVKNEDMEFFINYLLYVDKVIVTDHCGYYYRLNPNSVMRQPINMKSLTSIEASERMGKLLFEKGLIADKDIIVSNGVLNYTYSAAKQGNRVIYDYIHSHYDVRQAMRKMLGFPRFVKKLVAMSYLLLGRRIFYNLIKIFHK